MKSSKILITLLILVSTSIFSAFAQELPSSIPELKELANKGDAKAQNKFGDCYYDGNGVPQNYAEAVKYYRLAADQGYAEAQYNLGFCYYDGIGVPQNYEEAVKYFRQAADQNDSYAEGYLGSMYLDGKGVPMDYSEAIKYFKLSAEHGYSYANFQLGKCYLYGIGVPVNYEEAKKYIELIKNEISDNTYKTLINICNIKGRQYYGIGKLAGNPLDLALWLEVDGNVTNFNLANAVKKDLPCKWIQTGKNIRWEITTPDGKTAVLESTDDGETFNGKIDFNGKQMIIWVLKDLQSTFDCTINPDLLKNILASDSFVAFCELEISGQTGCVMGEFVFDKDGRFKLICDSSEVQKIFGNFIGTYQVGNDGALKLRTDNGTVLEGSIRGEGNKIIIPVGSKGGMKLTMKLIR